MNQSPLQKSHSKHCELPRENRDGHGTENLNNRHSIGAS